jgi:Dolichyl-phosphate-mannose-protein mannosyltransferase
MSTNIDSVNQAPSAFSNSLTTRRSIWACYAVIALAFVGAALIRFRLRDMPLERDEGEYAYVGQLMLHGVAPYRLAYSMKLPGAYLVYALILKIFGQTPRAVHEGLILINGLTICLVAILAARLFDWTAAMAAAASYALLSVSSSVLGFAGHATHFVVLPAVAAAIVLLEAKRRSIGQMFVCGLLVGLAFLMKQPGIMFAVFALLYLIVEEFQLGKNVNQPTPRSSLRRTLLPVIVGAVLPFLFTCLILWRAGVFPRFWFWTFTYAHNYAGIVSLAEGWHNLWASIPAIIGPSWPLWLLAGIGVSAFYWDPTLRRRVGFVLVFLVCSVVAVCAGLYFRQHYFILMLPALSVLAGAAVSSSMRRLPRGWPQMLALLVFFAALGVSILKQKDFLFRMEPITACRAVYGINPFPEAIKVADYIRSHSTKEDRIAILGSEPEIAFYAERVSATGYIYTYGLMEAQPYASRMQREMAAEIEAANPQFLVFVAVPSSWLPQPGLDPFVFNWGRNYVRTHYELVGLADILPVTEYRWGADVKNYQRRSRWALEVYKRVG